MIVKQMFIHELCNGQSIHDYFAVAEARQGQAKNGPFWHLRLQDRSGFINARIWSPLSGEFPQIAQESIVRIKGQVNSFRDELQLQVEQMEIFPSIEHSDLALFIPSGAQDPEQLLEALETLCRDELRHKPWRRLTHRVLHAEAVRGRFMTSFGGKSIHHAYLGGLLEHTLSVCRLALSIADNYPEVDREILLVAGVFHDLGKAWELSQGLATDYTDEGRLLGHIHITLEILAPFLRTQKDLDPHLAMHLKHLILSHHGEYEYGSPKRPKTAEALILHHADNIDAKMNIMEAAFDPELPEADGMQWSPFQRSMDRYLCRPVKTPKNDRTNKAQTGTQCLLPLKG
ncbi:MAG: 3'-5' exoribonuclease YhaM family protein [Desulfovibrionales bacterium]